MKDDDTQQTEKKEANKNSEDEGRLRHISE